MSCCTAAWAQGNPGMVQDDSPRRVPRRTVHRSPSIWQQARLAAGAATHSQWLTTTCHSAMRICEALLPPDVVDNVQVTISTPLGAAVATITPQLAKAALQHSTCRDILALPLHPCSSSSSSAAPMAAFSWSVQGNVPMSAGAAAGVEGSTGSSSNVSGAGMSTDVDEGTGSVSSAGASGSTGGLPLMHTLDAFAAVTVQIVRTPATANTKGVGKVFDPEAAAGSSAERKQAPAATNQMPADTGGAGTGSSSSVWQSSISLQVQLAVCAVLAALALQQSSGILVLLLQLLLLAAMAGAAVVTAKSSSASSSREPPARSSAGQQQPAAGAQQSSDSSSSENVRCCGWSIMLVTADLCSAPSRHLQLQVSYHGPASKPLPCLLPSARLQACCACCS